MRIAFTGHRDKITREAILTNLAKKYPNATWVHGGAVGFDSQVERIAQLCKIRTDIKRPDYKRYKPGIAPLIRNKEIVDSCDALIACYDGRERGGTYQAVNYAQQKGIKVHVIPCL